MAKTETVVVAAKDLKRLVPKLHTYRIMVAMKPQVLKEKWAKKPTKQQVLDRLLNELNRKGKLANLDNVFIVSIEEAES